MSSEPRAEAEVSASTLQERVRKLEALVKQLQRENSELAREHERALERIEELESEVSRGPPEDADADLLTVEKFSKNIPKDRREEVLGPSDRRALAIFENWWELADKTQKGWVVSTKRNSTKKNNPSQFFVDVRRITDEGLAAEQIYRAMQTLAKLTGGEYHQDDYGRDHVHGGAIEFHERVTPDGNRKYKLLVLADENSLTLL